MTDAQLLERARTDPSAFRTLYERYATRINAYHLARTGDPDAAHDLTAETFAQAWTHRLRFEDRAGGSAGPWLFGIARLLVLVAVRRRRLERAACERLGVLELLDRAPAQAEPDERWLAGLDDAWAELPVPQRRAIELRVASDLGYDEIARALATTPEAARARVSRGLGTLRTRLSQNEEPSR